MKNYNSFLGILMIILFFSPCTYAREKKIYYEIVRNIVEESCLNIRASIPSNNRQKLTIWVPPLHIKDLKINKSDGSLLKIPNYRKSGRLSLRDIKDKVTITYQLCADSESNHVDHPIIEKDFVHLISFNSLPYPIDDWDQKWNMHIKFKGFNSDDQFLTSNGITSFDFEMIQNMHAFHAFVFLINKEPAVSFDFRGKPIYLTIQGTHPIINKNLIPKFKRIMETQSTFWDEYETQPTLINILFSKKEEDAVGKYRTNALIFGALQDLNFAQIMHGFSHEFSHAWIGLKMKFTNLNTQWFMEGFNDYVGARLAVEGNVITKEDSLLRLNDLLKYYYSSELRSLSNDEIANIAHINIMGYKIAMARGHLVALKIENEVGTAPLDAIFKAIYKKAQSTKDNVISYNDLIKIFQQYLDKNLSEEIFQIIEQGKSFEPPRTLWNDSAELISVEKETTNYGFNVKQFFQQEKIQDLEDNCAAFAAGLRENMHVMSNNTLLHSASSIIPIKDEQGNWHDIKFIPEKRKAVAPQYILKTNDFSGRRQAPEQPECIQNA